MVVYQGDQVCSKSLHKVSMYSQTCLKSLLKNRQKKVLKINGSLLKV